MRTIELAKPVDAECATCNERVNWATHTAVECRNTLWRQREEARAYAQSFLEDIERWCPCKSSYVARNRDQVDWLKQQATVDE